MSLRSWPLIRIPGFLRTPMLTWVISGLAVGGGVGLVEQRHGGNGRLPGFHHQPHHLLRRQVLGGGGQGFHHEVVDGRFAETQDGGMIGVGGDPL